MDNALHECTRKTLVRRTCIKATPHVESTRLDVILRGTKLTNIHFFNLIIDK